MAAAAIHLYACNCLSQRIPELIDAVNGRDAMQPTAVTVGGAVFYFDPPSESTIRHEDKHVEQAARYCPRWLRWLPLGARAWCGWPAFGEAYLAEHLRKGYLGNFFEIEARSAEHPNPEPPTPPAIPRRKP